MDMKRTSALILMVFLALSCGSLNVKTVQENDDAVEAVKKAGLIIRVSRDVRIGRDDYVKSISHWIAGHKPEKNLLFVSDAGDKLTYFANDDDRFYQVTEDGSYLKFKSIGVVNLYLKDNREELKKIIDANSLDAIFIYEIYGVVANEMQFIDYDTVLVMADKNLKVIYMDRQNFNDDTSEIDFDRIKIKYLDSVSERLTRTLIRLDFMER
jgi:hypothetical protein